MTSWQEFSRYQLSKDTFLKRITTLEDFSNACTNSSFLAIRIKRIEKTSDSDRVLAQVGLAYLASLEPGDFLDCSSAKMPSLYQFYHNKGVKGLTVDVHIPQEEKDQILALRDMPVRRNLRFGKQLKIHYDNLAATVTGFLQGCIHDDNRNLVCVTFNDKAWTHMRDSFPEVMSHFSAYMDLEDIARDTAPNSGPIPCLKHCLELFHFDGELVSTEKPGRKADNAGENAVAVCAFANILLSSKNQRTFKYRLECGIMARHWEGKEVRLTFNIDAKFLVSVRTEARAALPYSLKSSWRIAQEFHAWNPKVAVRITPSEAHVQFHNKPDMQTFINDLNGVVYPSGETLSIMTYEEREKERQQEPGQRDRGIQEEDEQQECRQQQGNQQQAGLRLEAARQWYPEDQKQASDVLKELQMREYPEFDVEEDDEEETDDEDDAQEGWGQPGWHRQPEICRLQKEEQLKQPSPWFQQEDWAQPPKWDFPKMDKPQESNQQQPEVEERTAWNSAREYWHSEEESSEEESEEEENEEEEEQEMPELVEADPAADWEVLSD